MTALAETGTTPDPRHRWEAEHEIRHGRGKASVATWDCAFSPGKPNTPLAVAIAGEVQHQCTPPLVGVAGGQGCGDLSGQVPIEVDVTDIGWQDRTPRAGSRIERAGAVAPILRRGEVALEVIGAA